ncbi:hypothetical protein C0993_007020 [Termitomyces sp. T159_Od127]|nr:hypothetical protein C0993_007020 [Termitomyces sp. T159_Od127]
MAFSKPLNSPVSSSRSTTPLPESITPFQQSSTSITSDQHKSRRTPFALSFLSPTRMRVIGPPLHLTPAILQAVRGSWPRGVVSERKVGNNSFEFKLKGYKWFQQDTFATDSLRYILALLTSLDSQAFTLLSSISMTNRSRVKDLWIFTGPGSDDDIPHESHVSQSARDRFHEAMNRAHSPSNTGQSGSSTGISHHRRLLSEPTGSTTYVYPDMQGTTEQANAQKNFSLIHGYRAEYPQMGPALLRKPAPRAQVPVSIVHEADPPGTDGIRAYLPSMISSDVEDMTGVGTNGFEAPQTVSPSNQSQRSAARVLATSLSSSRRLSTSTRPRSPLRSVVNRQKTPPLLTVNPIQSSTSPAHDMSLQDLGTELLASEIFASEVRDTPGQQSEGKAEKNVDIIKTTSRRKVSSGSSRPGPIEGQARDSGYVIGSDVDHEGSMLHKRPSGNETLRIHEVSSRVASPELARPDIPLRKSEAALVGLIQDTSPTAALPATPIGTDSHNTGKGQGWVLVNVGESLTGSQVGLDESLDSTKRSECSEHMTPSPHARAIAVIDALDNKSNGKGKSTTFAPVKKRFLYLGRKNPVCHLLVSFS